MEKLFREKGFNLVLAFLSFFALLALSLPFRPALAAIRVHGDFTSTESLCEDCHRMLKEFEGEENFCLSCHDGVLAVGVAEQFNGKLKHGGREYKSCTYCHSPHAKFSKNPKLLKAKGKEGDEEFCVACHYNETTATQNWFLKSFRRGAHGSKARNSPVACLKCHLPHTSNTPHLLGVQGVEGSFQGELLCFACHKKIEEEFTYTSHHPVSSKELGLECVSCHNPHFVKKSELVDPQNTLETTEDATSFCLACHGPSWPQAIKATGVLVPYSIKISVVKSPFFAGWDKLRYRDSAHSQAGLDCLTCHDAHASRLFSLLALDGANQDLASESEICFSCHKKGGKAKGVKKEFKKKYRHPIESGGVHQDTEDQMGLAYSSKDGKRHVTCSDCHNSHQATAGNVLKGIAGVNELLEPVSQAKEEYQVCFKCHSSFTIQPPKQEDLASSFSPLNASFHPLWEKGKNADIKRGAFVGSWSSLSRVSCSDCHEPHGSDEAKLLKISLNREGPVGKSDFCFSCHNSSAYLAPSILTRFAAHSVHAKKFNCLVCHTAHGSERPYLLQTNFAHQSKSYKLNFTATSQGGSCSTNPQTGCHGKKEYERQY